MLAIRQNRWLLFSLTLILVFSALGTSETYAQTKAGSSVQNTLGTWQPGVPLLAGVGTPAEALGGDGMIYIIGGNVWNGSSNAATKTVQRFSEEAQSWEYIAPLPCASSNPAAGTDKLGNIHVFGGFSPDTITYNYVYRYDPYANAWVPVTHMLSSRCGARCVTDSKGRFWVAGGMTDSTWETSLATVERYDPSTKTWEDMPPMKEARGDGFAMLIDSKDRIFVFGGAAFGGAHLSSVEILDTAHLELGWQSKRSLAHAQHIQGALGPDGRFYLGGGWLPGYTDAVIVYDPRRDIYSSYASLPRLTNNFSMICGRSGEMYAIGGDNSVATVDRTRIPEVCLSPGPGSYFASQDYDLVFAVETPAGISVTGLDKVILHRGGDSIDITGILAPSFIRGDLAGSGNTLRWPGAGKLLATGLGPNLYSIEATVNLSNGWKVYGDNISKVRWNAE